MAEEDDTRRSRLTDWVILVFVLVVMGLLVADLADNVLGEADRRGSTPQGPAPVDSAQVGVTVHPPVAPRGSTNMAVGL